MQVLVKKKPLSDGSPVYSVVIQKDFDVDDTAPIESLSIEAIDEIAAKHMQYEMKQLILHYSSE